MKYLLLLASAVCFLSIQIAAQEIHYDKFKDFTLITSEESLLPPQGEVKILFGSPVIYFNCGFPGQTPPVNPDIVHFGINFRFRTSTWRFLERGSHELIMLVDDKRITLGQGSRSGDVDSSGRGVRVVERLDYDMRHEQFRSIANAKQIELQIGSFESAFDGPLLEQMRKTLAACVSTKGD